MSEATPILAAEVLAKRYAVSEKWTNQQNRDCYRGFEHELNPQIPAQTTTRGQQ
jgi:hypothetical protein